MLTKVLDVIGPGSLLSIKYRISFPRYEPMSGRTQQPSCRCKKSLCTFVITGMVFVFVMDCGSRFLHRAFPGVLRMTYCTETTDRVCVVLWVSHQLLLELPSSVAAVIL